MARKHNPDFAKEETAIEKARARDDLARKNELAELQEILLDDKVRKFLWRMLAKAGMYRTHFNPNAAIMGHNTGLADMGTMILNEILEANPEAWIVMQQDAYRKQVDEILLQQTEDQQATEE
jgi:hypothetical protein